MTTMLVFHICIALFSVVFTTHLWMRPTKRKLHVSYGLAGLTLASGTYLMLVSRTHLLEACAMGIAYLAVVSIGMVAARRTLAAHS